jgi:hypothetical protein
MNKESCPSSVVIIEPILDALSVLVPCITNNPSLNSNNIKYTHFIILPIPFSYYIKTKKYLPNPDTVVCIGCDSVFGPTQRMLETSFQRPYLLYLEFPKEYIHDAAFNKMNGEGKGQKLIFKEEFNINNNNTQYTKRSMKVLSYV